MTWMVSVNRFLKEKLLMLFRITFCTIKFSKMVKYLVKLITE